MKTGDVFYNTRNKKCKIVSILPNEPVPVYVYRMWNREKKYYNYGIETIEGYNIALDHGYYTIDKRS